jgi:hypothetical protein
MTYEKGMALLPVEEQQLALAAYDETRNTFLAWLQTHLVEGIHFGFPPGCSPKQADPLQWQAKPSLYKSGALLVCDLLKLRAEYDSDLATWEMMGKPKDSFIRKCTLYSHDTGAKLGEGSATFTIGEKCMQMNASIKMADKRALVAAVLNTVTGLADLFTQDLKPKGSDNSTPQGDGLATDQQCNKAIGELSITMSGQSIQSDDSWDGKKLLQKMCGGARPTGDNLAAIMQAVRNGAYDLTSGELIP